MLTGGCLLELSLNQQHYGLSTTFSTVTFAVPASIFTGAKTLCHPAVLGLQA